MAISKIEQLIINKLNNADNIVLDKNAYLIRLLSFDAIKELVNDENYFTIFRYLNNNTRYKVAEVLINGNVELNIINDKDYCFTRLLECTKPTKIREIIEIEPAKVVSNLINNLNYNSSFWRKLDSETLKIVFDVCTRDDLDIYILRNLVKLNDQDKLYYMTKFPLYDAELIDTVINSFSDKSLLKEAVRAVLKRCNWERCEAVFKYVNENEIFGFLDTFDPVTSYRLPEPFFGFSLDEKVTVLRTCLVDRKTYYNIKPFFQDIIKEVVSKKKFDVLNEIGNIYNEHKNSFLFIRIDEEIFSFLYEFSHEELLNFYKNCSFSLIKEFILSKKELWLNEEMISYLMCNQPDVIHEFLSRFNKEYDGLSDEIKSIFSKKENVLLFIQNSKYGGVDNYKDEFSTKAREYFLDMEFSKKIIDKKINMTSYVLYQNPSIQLFEYAIERGYIPDRSVYYFSKDKPEFFELWFKILNDFDPKNDAFPSLFNSLVILEDPKVIDVLMHKAAVSLNVSYSSFLTRFNALKAVNREILSSFDYRILHDRFSFFSMNKIEMIAAHREITSKLCELTSPELNVVKCIMNYSSDFSWVDLLDRVVLYIGDYSELVLDLYDKKLSVEELNKVIMIFSRPNSLKIKSYEDLCNYDFLVNQRINELVKENSIEGYKEAIALSLLGISYEEFIRINDVYCFDLENFIKFSDNQELINVMTLIKNVSNCSDIGHLKSIYENTPRVLYNPTFLVNLDAEIRKEFTKFYNNALYHVSDKDLVLSANYKEVVKEDGEVIFEPSLDGVEVSFYDPSSLMCGGSDVVDFGLMITSLGAYSDHKEPDDYYSSWNTDLIASHGFCCSYLTADNLGTARICHACLGFTDFDMGSLLLSAPYDIGSNGANKEFNTSRKRDTMFCTPRGMVNNTRHTHNEVVWERRNLSSTEEFKKEPSYVIFFCEDFDNLSDFEKRVYNSSVKAAIQLGKDKPLPVVLVDRSKIAAKNKDSILSSLNDSLINYKYGDFKKIICAYFNNKVGNTYCPGILSNYFNFELEQIIVDNIQMKILSAFREGKVELATIMYKDYCDAVENELGKKFKNQDLFEHLEKKFSAFKLQMDVLFSLGENTNKLSSDMVVAIANMFANDCNERFNASNIVSDSAYINEKEFVSKFLDDKKHLMLFQKLDQLAKLDIYVPNSPYDNRHIANTMLYAMMLCNRFDEDKVSCILDSIIFQTCSYMDGKEHMNLNSSLVKAEKLMLEAGYDSEKIDTIKLLMIIKDEKELTNEKLRKIIEEYKLNLKHIIDFSEYQKISSILHDASCLEHVRFITDGDLSERYFFDKEHFQYAKVAYALQESYAMCDIDKYLVGNIDKVSAVREMLSTKNPQEVIRDIRKERVAEKKHKNNSFEDAFLEIDVVEKTDPFNLVAAKMREFTDLPKQVSIIEFFKYVNNSNLYEYLIDKIDSRENLYLNLSDIHGETHANNVSLFALYIASRKQLGDMDTKILLEASLYHDIGRLSDHNDKHHGVYGALKYGTNVNVPEDVSGNEVKFLIEAHALSNLNDINSLFERYEISEADKDRLYLLATILRDADALDRTRFRLLESSNNLNPNLLVNIESKEIVESCLRLNYIVYQEYIAKKLEEKGMKL